MISLRILLLALIAFLLPACCWHDRSSESLVRDSGIIGKEFIITKDVAHWDQPAIWDANDHAPTLGFPGTPETQHYGKPDDTLPAGLRIKITEFADFHAFLMPDSPHHIVAQCFEGPVRNQNFVVDCFFARVPNTTTVDDLSFWDDQSLVPYLDAPAPWIDQTPAVAQQKMLEALESPQWSLRWHAAKALGDQKSTPAIIDALQKAQTDADQDVRLRASLSLARFDVTRPQTVSQAMKTIARSDSSRFEVLAARKIIAAAATAAASAR